MRCVSESEARAAEEYARAYLSATGHPLVVSGWLYTVLRRSGFDVSLVVTSEQLVVGTTRRTAAEVVREFLLGGGR